MAALELELGLEGEGGCHCMVMSSAAFQGMSEIGDSVSFSKHE